MADIVYNEVGHNAEWVSSQSWPSFFDYSKDRVYLAPNYDAPTQEKILRRVYELSCEQCGITPVWEDAPAVKEKKKGAAAEETKEA